MGSGSVNRTQAAVGGFLLPAVWTEEPWGRQRVRHDLGLNNKREERWKIVIKNKGREDRWGMKERGRG